ncbi:hypothetical protein [Aestuariivirga sp.]|uniref:hypothetical protein n=1 Tax=Aestuariivirga sp. TaxID=2650926 RepID=UPI003BAB384D
MAQTQSIKQKLDLRRAITSSAFVMILLVAVMGLFALFSIWSINRAWIEGTDRFTELRELSTASLEAQVAFKVQVQEWKNILLRGDNAGLLAKHHAAFTAQSAEVRSLLSSVSEQAQRIGFAEDATRADALSQAHEALNASYEKTLAEVQGSLPTLSAAAARDIDQRLRGADRALESGIGTLAADIGHTADARRAELVAGMKERYEALRWFIVSIILGAILITGYVLFGILRATRN